MAIAANTIWSFNASSTAAMVNGGGFNTANANFLTNATATSATGNAPVISSASYNFVAGDVGNWIYIQSGTNWTPGFYKISSVAANAATVNATIGAAVQLNTTTNRYGANTVAGVATTASPTSGVFGVDYSQSTAAILTSTDLASTTGTTNPSTVTSVAAPFGVNHVGNIIHVTAGTNWTVGWYEIVSVSVVTATLDRAVGSSATITAGTAKTGGSSDLNSAALPDAFFEQIVGGNLVYFKAGTYTLGGTIAVASAASTGLAPSEIIGFNSIRGDNPSAFGASANIPVITLASNQWTAGAFQNTQNMSFTSTSAGGFILGSSSVNMNIKSLNSSTLSRIAITGGNTSMLYNAEAISQNGTALSAATDTKIYGCYFHNSLIALTLPARTSSQLNVIQSCLTGLSFTATSMNLALNNTLYGYSTPRGTGVLIAAGVTGVFLGNNIVANFATGVSQTTAQQFINRGANNDFNGNTSNFSNYTIDVTDVTTSPSFTNVTEITGSTATTSGSVLTQAGGNFSTVTDGIDFLQVFSGTGVTTGGYLITSHTSTTVTVNNALGTSSGGDVVYSIPTGRNLSVGTNMKALAFPGVFGGSSTTGYLDIGAVQRQEAGGSATIGSAYS